MHAKLGLCGVYLLALASACSGQDGSSPTTGADEPRSEPGKVGGKTDSHGSPCQDSANPDCAPGNGEPSKQATGTPGEPQRLAKGFVVCELIAATEKQVLWVDFGESEAADDRLISHGKADGTQTTLAGSLTISGLSVWQDQAFFVADSQQGSSVWTVPVDGSAQATQLVSTESSIASLQAGSSGLFWLQDGALHHAQADGQGLKVLDVLPPETSAVVARGDRFLAVSAGDVWGAESSPVTFQPFYNSPEEQDVVQAALTQDAAYALQRGGNGNDRLMRLLPNSSSAEVLVSAPIVSAFAATDRHLYALVVPPGAPFSHELRVTSRVGDQTETTSIQGAENPCAMTVDHDGVYWTDYAKGEIWMAPLLEGSP